MGVLKEITEKEKERLFSQIESGEKIEREVSFSWDGKNLIVRFPRDVAGYLDVNEENRFKKNLKFIVEEKDGKVDKRFEIVERTKPKREVKKKDDKNKTKA